MSQLCHQLPYTVQVHDTDCYGVVWHGTYSRWLETARVTFCEALGIIVDKPGQADYIYPVVEQHLQFKDRATVRDKVIIETALQLQGCRLVFTQIVYRDKVTILSAKTTCVVVDSTWQLQKRMPAFIKALVNELIE